MIKEYIKSTLITIFLNLSFSMLLWYYSSRDAESSIKGYEVMTLFLLSLGEFIVCNFGLWFVTKLKEKNTARLMRVFFVSTAGLAFIVTLFNSIREYINLIGIILITPILIACIFGEYTKLNPDKK